MNAAIEVAQILAEDRLIEMVFGAEVAFDFGRSRFAFAIKGPARHDADHDKGEEADEQQQRRQEKNAFQEIHSIHLTTISGKMSNDEILMTNEGPQRK